MSRLSEEGIKNACKPKDAATDGFVFQQTMLRVKDIAASLNFYTDILGMQLIADFHFEQWKFSVYFLAYVKPENIPEDPTAKMAFLWNQPACLELTHNHGSETDGTTYHNGNSEPGRGFGHIGITVPDLEGACARFEEKGVTFKKRLTDGNMKTLAFIQDPDGYMIEILSNKQPATF